MVPAFVVSGLGLLKEGIQTNWWGLACPAHCQSPGLGLLLVVFLAGCLSGILFGGLALVYFYWVYLRTLGPAPAAQAQPSASRLSRRQASLLRGYLYAEGQGSD